MNDAQGIFDPLIRKKLEYSHSAGAFILISAGKPINCIVANDSHVKLYALEKYADLFPDYDAHTDSVIQGKYGNIITLTHKRILPNLGHQLSTGLYKIIMIDWEIGIKPIPELVTDKYIDLSYSSSKLTKDIELFVTRINLYKELGLRPRRGCLLYGPPGNGKTFQIIRAINSASNNFNSIIFFLSSSHIDLSDLFPLRDILQDRNVIFVIEELTELASQGTDELLGFLDGEFSWDNCYIIATTNYPELLPANIIDRPGRFDLLIEFDNPNAHDREKYLNTLYGSTVDDLIISDTEGFSIAYLKELVLRSKFYDMSLTDVHKELKLRKQKIRDAFEVKDKIGF